MNVLNVRFKFCGIENKIKGSFLFNDSEDVWEQVRAEAPYRYGGASYRKLKRNR